MVTNMTGDPQNRFPFDDGPQDTEAPAPRINEQQASAPQAEFGAPDVNQAPAAPEHTGVANDADLAHAPEPSVMDGHHAPGEDRLASAVARSRTIDPDQGVNSTRGLDDVRDAYANEHGHHPEPITDIDHGADADAFAMPPAAADAAPAHTIHGADADFGEPTVAMHPDDVASLRTNEHTAPHRVDDDLDGADDAVDAGYAPKPVANHADHAEPQPATLADELRSEAVAEHERETVEGPRHADEDAADSASPAVASGAAGAALAGAAAARHGQLDGDEVPEAEEHRRHTVEIDRTQRHRAASEADDEATFAPLSVQDDEEPLEKPAKRSNRGFGILIAFLASLVFAAAYAAVTALYRRLYTPQDDLMGTVMSFIPSAEFWLPVAVFFLFGILWALIVNRAGWWSYIIGGLLAGLATAAAYPFGSLVQHGINTGTWNFAAFEEALLQPEHLAPMLIAFILAREIFTWVGGFAALRGRRLTKKHRTATNEYERALADREAARIDATRNVSAAESDVR